MKNIKFIILLLTVAVFTVSCETYDDYTTDRKPVVGFAVKNKNINTIAVGTPKSTTLDVFASTVSSEDRTFNVITVPIEDTEANPPAATENFTFDSTVTIPANERVGVITVTGINVSLTTERVYFKLAIENDETAVAGGQVIVGLKGR